MFGSKCHVGVRRGSGLDWLLLEAAEHSPLSLAQMQMQLQAIAANPITPAIRVPSADPVTIKQVLDLGVQNIVVPMVSDADQARAAVAARQVRGQLERGGGW